MKQEKNSTRPCLDPELVLKEHTVNQFCKHDAISWIFSSGVLSPLELPPPADRYVRRKEKNIYASFAAKETIYLTLTAD